VRKTVNFSNQKLEKGSLFWKKLSTTIFLLQLQREENFWRILELSVPETKKEKDNIKQKPDAGWRCWGMPPYSSQHAEPPQYSASYPFILHFPTHRPFHGLPIHLTGKIEWLWRSSKYFSPPQYSLEPYFIAVHHNEERENIIL